MGLRRILKFELTPFGDTVIRTANTPRDLTVAWQGDRLVLWVEATPEDEFGYVTTTYVLVVTGQDAPGSDFTYVGTAQHPTLNDGGPLVIHAYRAGMA